MRELRAYLLAAGRGRRAGGPKAWLPYGSGTLLLKQISFLKRRTSPANIFVSVQEAWLERCRAMDPGVRWIAADPDAAPLASLQALVLASGAGVWASLHHVDMPVWEPALFALLAEKAEEAEASGAEAVLPVFEARAGHPVFLAPSSLALLTELDAEKSRLDLWLKGRRVLRVDAPFACIHQNWNAGAPV